MDTDVRAVPRSTASGDPSEQVVTALVAEGLLAVTDRARGVEVVARALGVPQRAQPTRGMPKLVEVVAYLGGALVLAAAALFLMQQWENLQFGMRVLLMALVTGALAVGGGFAARIEGGHAGLLEESGDARRRLTSTLLVAAALSAAFLVGLVWDHQLPDQRTFPEIYWPLVAGALVLMAGSAVAYAVAPTALGQAGILAGALTAAMNLLGTVQAHDAEWNGVTMFAIGAGWVVLAEVGLFREATVARAAGVATALLGAQIPVMDGTTAWLGYLLTGLVVAAGIWLYLLRVAWPYLAAAVLGVTLVVPEMVSDWTEGSLGVVGGVLVAGLTLLLASYAGYRLRSEVED